MMMFMMPLFPTVNANIPGLNLEIDPALPKPTPVQVEQLRQLFLVGSVCHLAAKYDLPAEGLPAKDRRRLRYAYKVSFFRLNILIFFYPCWLLVVLLI